MNRQSSRPSRIAFGSCNNQNMTSPLWPIIESRDVAAFVWGGDAVYSDYNSGLNFSSFPPYTATIEATPEVFDGFYQQLRKNPAYASFLNNSSNITVFGTYDDHDYGVNNGDKTYKYAKQAGVAFLKFTGEPKTSPMFRRAENGFGLYGVKMFDFSREVGNELMTDAEAGIDPDVVPRSNKTRGEYLKTTVAVFVLDCRTNKSPWRKMSPDFQGDMLGERQWQWFEAAIANSRAEVNVIVNGLQVNPDTRIPDANIYERWGAFPTARQRLYDAILQDGVKAPFLISGDVHMSQLLRKDCYAWDPQSHRMLPSSSRRVLMELTTSGMTHSWGTCTSTRLKHHYSWHAFFSHLISKYFMELAHLTLPMKDLVISNVQEDDDRDNKDDAHCTNDSPLYESGGAENAKKGLQYSLDLNFGELEFDWEKKILTVRTLGKELNSPPLLAAKYHFDQLSGSSAFPGGDDGLREMVARNLSTTFDAHRQDFLPRLSWSDTKQHQWVCIDHRGSADPLRITASYTFITFVMVGLPLFSILALAGFMRRKISYLFVSVNFETSYPKSKKFV